VLHSITPSCRRNRGDRCTGNKSSYPKGAVCERFLTKKASAAFTRLTSACDPTETWTAEIFQRKLTVEPPSGSCKYLL
jgi:hypothetical protein